MWGESVSSDPGRTRARWKLDLSGGTFFVVPTIKVQAGESCAESKVKRRIASWKNTPNWIVDKSTWVHLWRCGECSSKHFKTSLAEHLLHVLPVFGGSSLASSGPTALASAAPSDLVCPHFVCRSSISHLTWDHAFAIFCGCPENGFSTWSSWHMSLSPKDANGECIGYDIAFDNTGDAWTVHVTLPASLLAGRISWMPSVLYLASRQILTMHFSTSQVFVSFCIIAWQLSVSGAAAPGRTCTWLGLPHRERGPNCGTGLWLWRLTSDSQDPKKNQSPARMCLIFGSDTSSRVIVQNPRRTAYVELTYAISPDVGWKHHEIEILVAGAMLLGGWPSWRRAGTRLPSLAKRMMRMFVCICNHLQIICTFCMLFRAIHPCLASVRRKLRSHHFSHWRSKVPGLDRLECTMLYGELYSMAKFWWNELKTAASKVNNATVSQAEYQKRLEGINILSKAGEPSLSLIFFYFTDGCFNLTRVDRWGTSWCSKEMWKRLHNARGRRAMFPRCGVGTNESIDCKQQLCSTTDSFGLCSDCFVLAGADSFLRANLWIRGIPSGWWKWSLAEWICRLIFTPLRVGWPPTPQAPLSPQTLENAAIYTVFFNCSMLANSNIYAKNPSKTLFFLQCFYTVFSRNHRNLHVFRHRVGPKQWFLQCFQGSGIKKRSIPWSPQTLENTAIYTVFFNFSMCQCRWPTQTYIQKNTSKTPFFLQCFYTFSVENTVIYTFFGIKSVQNSGCCVVFNALASKNHSKYRYLQCFFLCPFFHCRKPTKITQNSISIPS